MQVVRLSLGLVVLISCASSAFAQTFTSNPGAIPQGSPFNASYTESVNFADVDLDGDLDAAFADGGDCCNDQNRLWLNQGGAQGGTVGTFLDATAAAFPVVNDSSRNLEFADIDADGDADLHISNHSSWVNQTSRWWVNQGGVQGGSSGTYTDQTSTRWVGLGGSGSSVHPSLVLPSGGFIDWSAFAAFGDLDADGDLDLVHSSYGPAFNGNVPSRVFLNDGNGFFQEFNPSGFQLTGVAIVDGDPGLWCEGLQQNGTTNATGQFCDIAMSALSVDLGDIDGDFDLDLVHGSRNDRPRLFRNRVTETGGTLSFRDVSNAQFPANWSTGTGHYEQELGDMDDDGDLDIYGLNWLNLTDGLLKNNGDGTFAPPITIPGSGQDDNEAEWVDYDRDGDLDVFIAVWSGPNRMFQNSGASGGYGYSVASGVLPTTSQRSLAAATADVDQDGDSDVFTAEDVGLANVFLENHTDVVDTHAPRVFKVEQVPSRAPSATPTVVRALIYDNEPWLLTAQELHQLVYRVNGGSATVLPVQWVGGNLFRGELPGALEGDVCYRVRSTDFYGNTSESPERCFHSGVGAGSVSVYCTSKTNSEVCYPQLSFSGVPSTTSASGFVVGANNVLNNKFGLFFYSLAGKQAVAFQGGYLCVKLPTKRTPTQNSAGQPPPNDCSGGYVFDFNAYAASGADPAVQVTGTTVWGQWWQRDPGFAPPNNTGLTEAIEFVMQ
ncbi:MAG: VCBS repeat-containing protein [Planctomycetes bacterium]|nr:VCBS repeat-containing protein [Planctomycetota bacterium]